MPKIRSSANKIKLISGFTALLLGMLSCSQGYISPVELTATAQAAGPVNTKPAPTVMVFTPTETEAASTPIPTFTDLPPQTNTPRPTVTIDPKATPKPLIQYYTLSGDTLPSIIGRFGVKREDIISTETIPETGLIRPGALLLIPDVLTDVLESISVMPDSEVVFSPSAADFNVKTFVNEAGGYLSKYVEQLSSGPTAGADIVKRVALENSINPYLLLALIEYKSHWVYGNPTNMAEADYPMGMVSLQYKGLYRQLSWTVQQLSIGYYGWRAGILATLPFIDGTTLHISPGLNAGTAAVQYLFAQWFDQLEWAGALYGDQSMPKLMEEMFGNFRTRTEKVEPLYPPDLQQPQLELPFLPKRIWSYTGGPHSAWGPDGALAAIDFAPPASESGCVQSNEWVTAMASGVIVRSENGLVIEDLDGDGIEQTGWNIMYLHIETRDRVAVGTKLKTGDKIGHPSCEGGTSTGTHTHVVRKYNGEWILAGGPLPFTLSGYVAQNGDKPYAGTLVKGDQIVIADQKSAHISDIQKPVP